MANKILVYTQQGAPLGLVDPGGIELQPGLSPSLQAEYQKRLDAIQKSTGRKAGKIGIAKGKNDKPVLAVFDQQGNLIGTIDPDSLKPVQTSAGQKGGPPSTAEANANAAAVQQNLATAEVQKAMGQMLHSAKPRPPLPAGTVYKAAASLDDQWRNLLQTIGTSAANSLNAKVGSEALKLSVGGAATTGRAVTICKRAAVSWALGRKII